MSSSILYGIRFGRITKPVLNHIQMPVQQYIATWYTALVTRINCSVVDAYLDFNKNIYRSRSLEGLTMIAINNIYKMM